MYICQKQHSESYSLLEANRKERSAYPKYHIIVNICPKRILFWLVIIIKTCKEPSRIGPIHYTNTGDSSQHDSVGKDVFLFLLLVLKLQK